MRRLPTNSKIFSGLWTRMSYRHLISAMRPRSNLQNSPKRSLRTPWPGGIPSQGDVISPLISPTAAVQMLPSCTSARNRKVHFPASGMARRRGSMTFSLNSDQDAHFGIGAGPRYLKSAVKFDRVGTSCVDSVRPTCLSASNFIDLHFGAAEILDRYKKAIHGDDHFDGL